MTVAAVAGGAGGAAYAVPAASAAARTLQRNFLPDPRCTRSWLHGLGEPGSDPETAWEIEGSHRCLGFVVPRTKCKYLQRASRRCPRRPRPFTASRSPCPPLTIVQRSFLGSQIARTGSHCAQRHPSYGEPRAGVRRESNFKGGSPQAVARSTACNQRGGTHRHPYRNSLTPGGRQVGAADQGRWRRRSAPEPRWVWLASGDQLAGALQGRPSADRTRSVRCRQRQPTT